MIRWPFALWGEDGSDDEGTDDGEGSEGDEGEGSDGDEGSDEAVPMTKGQLEATIARAVSRATRKDRKSQRETLGFESQDALSEFVKSARDAEAASKSEAEQAAAEVEKAKAALVSDAAALGQERIDLAVERAVIGSGITDEATVKRIRILVRSELGNDFDVEALAEEVKDALEAVKTDIPAIFDTEDPKPSGSGDGGKKDNKPKTDEQKKEAQIKQFEAEYARRYGLTSTPT